EAEARRYRVAFFDAYPDLLVWHHQASLTGYRPVDTRTPAGRLRAGVERFTEKLNSPVQGAGADGLKAALALLWERRAECPAARLVSAVHDELVLEVDEGQEVVAAQWLRGAMLDGMRTWCDPVPVEVEIKAGRTWGTCVPLAEWQARHVGG